MRNISLEIFVVVHRDHLIRVQCQKKIILHINKHLEAKVLGKMSKTSRVRENHSLIQVSTAINKLPGKKTMTERIVGKIMQVKKRLKLSSFIQ